MQFITRRSGFLVTLMLAVLLSFGLLATSAPAQEGQTGQSVPAQAAQKCTPVARLFGQTVCREDIMAADEHQEDIRRQYESQGLDPDEAMESQSRDQLKDMLWMIALNRKFGAQALEPTAEEIYLYSNAFRNSLSRSHQENLRNAEKIRTALAHRTYTQEEELKLRSLLGSLETSIAFYNEREKHREQMPPEFEQMVAEAERGIAESAIRDWRVNKALYEEYGGNLVLRPSGVQPVEAYAKFVDYVRSEGKPEILDPAYKDVFREMEQFAAGHGEPLSGEKEAFYKGYFSGPLWQFEHRADIARDTQAR